jgi:hypothetical protein
MSAAQRACLPSGSAGTYRRPAAGRDARDAEGLPELVSSRGHLLCDRPAAIQHLDRVDGSVGQCRGPAAIFKRLGNELDGAVSEPGWQWAELCGRCDGGRFHGSTL